MQNKTVNGGASLGLSYDCMGMELGLQLDYHGITEDSRDGYSTAIAPLTTAIMFYQTFGSAYLFWEL